MKLYGISTCDTCRKARKALPQAEFIDVRSDGIAENVLRTAFKHFENRLLNTRSTTWRGLSEDERQDPPITLILRHPTLMKRPLIVDGDQMVLGFDKAAQTELGLS